MDNYTIADYSIQYPTAPMINGYLEYLTISITFLIFVIGGFGVGARILIQRIQRAKALCGALDLEGGFSGINIDKQQPKFAINDLYGIIDKETRQIAEPLVSELPRSTLSSC